MGWALAIALTVLACVLFLSVKKGWISNQTLQTMANIAGVIALLAATAVFVIPAAAPSVGVDTPAPSETPSPSPTFISEPKPKAEPLEITFEPNPVTPVWDESGYWVWWCTYSVYNPNDFPVEVAAFGGLNECLSDKSECSFSPGEFALWFAACGQGSNIISAKGTACDTRWWVRLDYDPGNDVVGKYAIYFRDEHGEVNKSISEEVVLLKP